MNDAALNARIDARIAVAMRDAPFRGTRPARVPPPHPHELFAVRVTQSGGGAGDAEAQCTFTYQVKDWDQPTTYLDDTEATPIGPQMRRREFGLTLAGLVGAAFRDQNGDLVLLWVDEIPDQAVC